MADALAGLLGGAPCTVRSEPRARKVGGSRLGPGGPDVFEGHLGGVRSAPLARGFDGILTGLELTGAAPSDGAYRLESAAVVSALGGSATSRDGARGRWALMALSSCWRRSRRARSRRRCGSRGQAGVREGRVHAVSVSVGGGPERAGDAEAAGEGG
jgi:hypothetical protein